MLLLLLLLLMLLEFVCIAHDGFTDSLQLAADARALQAVRVVHEVWHVESRAQLRDLKQAVGSARRETTGRRENAQHLSVRERER